MILLASFPAKDASENAVQARVAGYRIALDDVPSWAVEAAAKRWIRGDGMTPARFAPTPPELRQAALAVAEAADGEAAALWRMLNARQHVEREISDAEREKVARRFAGILSRTVPTIKADPLAATTSAP